jgi:hypothetical protein
MAWFPYSKNDFGPGFAKSVKHMLCDYIWLEREGCVQCRVHMSLKNFKGKINYVEHC